MEFTLEKIPEGNTAPFTLLTIEEPSKSTGLLRVEGRFVNPVQVNTVPAPERMVSSLR